MWLPSDGRPNQCPVEVWEDKYAASREGWIDGTLHAKEAVHIGEVMALVGDVKGKDVLDLGGGALLCRAMTAAGAGSLSVVDYSRSACEVVRDLGCWAAQDDILSYLKNVRGRFHVTLSFGVFDYLPPGSLEVLFERCPSPVLVLGITNGESYLQYKTRTCAYSTKDVMGYASKYGWVVEEHVADKTSHTWARFRRVKA